MKILRVVFTFLVAVSIPLFLIMTVIRLLFSPLSISIEYNLPGFPDDPYGFTKEDRLYWANISIEYLVENKDISFLADQKLADGQPLFNQRELSHMFDVQVLLQRMIRVWIGLGILLALLAILAWRLKWLAFFWRGVSTGGWITLGLIGLILVGIFVGFSGLFTGFHRIFFTGDTWLFYYSDSLIRLFPEKLWQDSFTAAGVLTGLFGLLCALIPRRWAVK